MTTPCTVFIGKYTTVKINMMALKVLIFMLTVLILSCAEELQMNPKFVFDLVNYHQSKNIIFHIFEDEIHPFTTRFMRKINLEG